MSDPVEHTLPGPQGSLSWRQLATGLRHDPQIRATLTQAILRPGHEAVFWETSPSSRATVDHPLRFVLLPGRSLARLQSDPRPFEQQLRRGGLVATFGNLSGDAILVAPTPTDPPRSYPHLVAFLQHAPPEQLEALWSAVGVALEGWWADRADPVWLSTSGLGVAWLHIRLDRYPKYYHHDAFGLPPGSG
ncbi:MAG TPA: hypothetical protein ENK18_01380 [Deltaproteobacteria bacterium]|nr:hypothetical protein [Deltaproteobacteria bacterium]